MVVRSVKMADYPRHRRSYRNVCLSYGSLSDLLVVAEIEYFDILKYINENKNMDLIMDFKNYQENTLGKYNLNGEDSFPNFCAIHGLWISFNSLMYI